MNGSWARARLSLRSILTGREAAVAGGEGYGECPVEDGECGGEEGGATTSAVAGDFLTAQFAQVWAEHLAEVHGDGHTALRRVSADRSGEYGFGRFAGDAISAVRRGLRRIARAEQGRSKDGDVDGAGDADESPPMRWSRGMS